MYKFRPRRCPRSIRSGPVPPPPETVQSVAGTDAPLTSRALRAPSTPPTAPRCSPYSTFRYRCPSSSSSTSTTLTPRHPPSPSPSAGFPHPQSSTSANCTCQKSQTLPCHWHPAAEKATAPFSTPPTFAPDPPAAISPPAPFPKIGPPCPAIRSYPVDPGSIP